MKGISRGGKLNTEPLFCAVGKPRSGTIWTTRLVGQAIGSPTQTRDVDDRMPIYKDDPAVWGQDRLGGLIRRLHYYADAYPYRSPVLLVVRDPRDLAVSQAYFYSGDEPADPIGRFKWVLGRWVKFHEEWLRDRRMMTYVRYEDLYENPQRELGRIVLALINHGLSIHRVPTSKQVACAVHDNSFDRMENWTKRKGTVGEWREHFDKASVQLWEKARREHGIFAELGY